MLQIIAAILWIIAFFVSKENKIHIETLNQIVGNTNNFNEKISWDIITPINVNNGYITINKEENKIIKKSKFEEIIEKRSYMAKWYVIDFYNFLNNKNRSRMRNLFDDVLKNNNDIKIYFSENRINRFLNLIDWTVKIYNDDINELKKYRKDTEFVVRRWFSYILQYEVDWKIYKEKWHMILISRDGGNRFLISELICETKWCSRFPFFDFK